jgi:hypothetical protein
MSNLNNRFEIGIIEPADALDHSPTIRGAFNLAAAFAQRNPEATVYVFDTLARSGQAQLWHYNRMENALRVKARAEDKTIKPTLIETIDRKIAESNQTARRMIELEARQG